MFWRPPVFFSTIAQLASRGRFVFKQVANDFCCIFEDRRRLRRFGVDFVHFSTWRLTILESAARKHRPCRRLRACWRMKNGNCAAPKSRPQHLVINGSSHGLPVTPCDFKSVLDVTRAVLYFLPLNFSMLPKLSAIASDVPNMPVK